MCLFYSVTVTVLLKVFSFTDTKHISDSQCLCQVCKAFTQQWDPTWEYYWSELVSVQSLGQYSSVWLGQASLVCSLSHKLWCYSRISSPEKSHNNSCKKNTIFFLCVFDIANQLLTHHSPFASLSQVDKWMAKPSPFSILGCLLQFFLDYGL